MEEQPLPTKNTSTPIVDLIVKDLSHFQDYAAPAVIDDLWQRKALGIERYGAPLQAHNGRDAHRDAYEEAVDLAVYLRQCFEELGSVYFPLYRDALGMVLRLRKLRPGLVQAIRDLAAAGGCLSPEESAVDQVMRQVGEPPIEPLPIECPQWCGTYSPLDMSSALDGDRRYATQACRDAGRCVTRS